MWDAAQPIIEFWFGGRSFRSTDAIADSSRKSFRRRAGVSVVSSAVSIRRDRRATSDLLIARRSRSSISSSKVPRPQPSADAKKASPSGRTGRATLLPARWRPAAG
jgi:hypothetical protein